MTTVETAKKISSDTICIRPFLDPNMENMGLENYGMVLHEGSSHKEWITCIEKGGIKRYLTGLNEFAPEIEYLSSKEEKEAKVKAIREKVIYLEKVLAGNDQLDIKSKDFWKNVKVVRPDNYEFWQDITLQVDNNIMYMDEKDPIHVIIMSAIEAKGFGCVASSLEEARSSSANYKWYLDRRRETANTKASYKIVKNKALSLLHELYETNPEKLWLIAKCIDPASAQYKSNMPPTIFYDSMDTYINGFGSDKTITKASQMFIETAALDEDILRIRAVIKDASYYRYLVNKEDGNVYHVATNERIGKTLADCIQFFKSEINAKIWHMVHEEVKANWS